MMHCQNELQTYNVYTSIVRFGSASPLLALVV